MKIRSNLCLLLGLFCLSLGAYANEDSQSGAVELEYDGLYGRQYSEHFFRDPIKLKVKLYENGHVDIDNFEWSYAQYRNKLETIDADININFLGFYREELNRTIGAEIGMEIADINIKKIIKSDDDEFSYIIEGFLSVDKVWNIKTHKENSFVESNLEVEPSSNSRHFRGDAFSMDYGVSAGLKYDTDKGFVGGSVYYKNSGKRSLTNEYDEEYNYSGSEVGVKFTFKPNSKKCHEYAVGAKQASFEQSLIFGINQFSDNQVYVTYTCRGDLMDIFFSKTDTGEGLIRY